MEGCGSHLESRFARATQAAQCGIVQGHPTRPNGQHRRIEQRCAGAQGDAGHLARLCKQRGDRVRDKLHLERIAHALAPAPTAHTVRSVLAASLRGASQRSQRRSAHGGAHTSLGSVVKGEVVEAYGD